MSAVATATLTTAGVALIAVAAVDAFETVLRPEGRGPLARRVARTVWKAFRSLRADRRGLQVAGPMALLAVVGVWAALLILGWALVLWPHLEDGFAHRAGETGFWDALHVSLTSLTTLGFADAVPQRDWLEVVTPLEALVGFGLLSASISYLLLIYPVLARRRSLAYEVSLIREAEGRGLGVEHAGPQAAERLYAELTSRVVSLERDLMDFPVTYYFGDADERFSWPAQAPYLLDLARRGSQPQEPEGARFHAALLADALHDLALTTAALFHRVRRESSKAIFEAQARDHRVGLERAP